MTTYFEELSVDEPTTFGTYVMTREEILEFAERWDPQPFHVDEQAAEASIYGGLIASGWHVAAATMRLLVDGYLADVAGMGSPGLEELRWLAPVRPGDELSIRVTIRETRDLSSRPDRGLAVIDVETLLDGDEVGMRMVANMLIGRREPVDGA